MPRARLIQTDYSDFRRLLREASGLGGLLRPGDGDKWQEYIRAKEINEFGAMAVAKGRFEGPLAVIVNLGGESDGLYVYSESDEQCLRMVFLE